MAREPLARFGEATVLVVDDNENNLALISAVMTRAGIRRVLTESDSRRVIGRLLEEIEPDLIILDLHMPHVDGYAVLEHIIEFSGGSYVPILVLTADNTVTAIQRALEAGAHDYVTKPFDQTELLLRARNLLENRFLRVTLRRHVVSSAAHPASDIPTSSVPTSYVPAYSLDPAPMSSPRGGLIDRELARHRRDRVASALEPGNIAVQYQPVIDTSVSTVVGHEALARFPRDTSRPIEQWFTEAFELGIGTELEIAALREAIKGASQLPPGTFLAVNISPRTALSGQLDDAIPVELCPNLVLELTEHAPVENYDAILDSLAGLRAQGARLAIDDTGAGYAGFRHLLSLQPEIIKLDISLTRGVDKLPTNRALASALVSFAADVDSRLIAEGVETAAEASTLVDLGITWMQGFVFGRPSFRPLRDLELRRAAAPGV